MIHIFYTLNKTKFTQNEWDRYILEVPYLFREKILKLVRWEDKQNSLTGKLLLKYGLTTLYNPSQKIEYVKLSSFGKPFIPSTDTDSDVFFNISHSANCSVCAFNVPNLGGGEYNSSEIREEEGGNNFEIGIDIEYIKPIKIEDFFSVFTKQEQQIISKSISPLHSFYNIWTRKESVLKAEGSGLTNHLKELCVSKNFTVVNSNRWYTYPIKLSPNYISHIAVKECFPQISIQYIPL